MQQRPQEGQQQQQQQQQEEGWQQRLGLLRPACLHMMADGTCWSAKAQDGE
jgi:hypothetical protein